MKLFKHLAFILTLLVGIVFSPGIFAQAIFADDFEVKLQELTVKREGLSIEVVEKGNLRGLKFEFPENELYLIDEFNPKTRSFESVKLEKVKIFRAPKNISPPIPDDIVPLTDIFYVSPIGIRESVPIRILMPINGFQKLPDTSHHSLVSLFWYSSTQWLSGMVNEEFHKNSISGELAGLSGFMFFGVDKFPTLPKNINHNTDFNNKEGKNFSNDVLDYTCLPISETLIFGIVTDVNCHKSGINIKMRNLALAAGSFLIGLESFSYEKMLGWVDSSIKLAKSFGLYTGIQNINITVLCRKDLEEGVGFTNDQVLYSTLFIDCWLPERNPNGEIVLGNTNQIRFTVVHELFHNAQYLSSATSSPYFYSRVLRSDLLRWIIEGSAVWFENRLYPDEKPYLVRPPLSEGGKVPNFFDLGIPAHFKDNPKGPDTYLTFNIFNSYFRAWGSAEVMAKTFTFSTVGVFGLPHFTKLLCEIESSTLSGIDCIFRLPTSLLITWRHLANYYRTTYPDPPDNVVTQLFGYDLTDFEDPLSNGPSISIFMEVEAANMPREPDEFTTFDFSIPPYGIVSFEEHVHISNPTPNGEFCIRREMTTDQPILFAHGGSVYENGIFHPGSYYQDRIDRFDVVQNFTGIFNASFTATAKVSVKYHRIPANTCSSNKNTTTTVMR